VTAIVDSREIRHYASGGAWIIEAPEEFDVSSAPALRELTIRLQGTGAAVIVIDLSAVTFMDSVALGVVAAAWDRCRRAEGWLAVAGAGEAAARKFRTTGLSRWLPAYPATEDAIAAAQSGAAGRRPPEPDP